MLPTLDAIRRMNRRQYVQFVLTKSNIIISLKNPAISARKQASSAENAGSVEGTSFAPDSSPLRRVFKLRKVSPAGRRPR